MDDGRFDPDAVGRFHVTGRAFDERTRTATLRYTFDRGCEFVETVRFESPPASSFDPDDPRIERAMLHLHVAAGTSYYKTAAPDRVIVDDGCLTSEDLAFHRHLYDDGLREFAVRNGLPVPRPVTVVAEPAWRRSAEVEPVEPGTAARAGAAARAGEPAGARPVRQRTGPHRAAAPDVVVPIGGGKDSMVMVEALRPLRPRLIAVNPHPRVLDLASRAGLELLVVRRTLSPELDRLNAAGARNGHVPVTAIVSLICILGAPVYGYDTIAMAIERSASEETVSVGGVPVNHQYSKSVGFERLLRRLTTSSIDAGLAYGSALRPYSELAIGRAFARLGRYHGSFCSCNAVYRRTAGASESWCGRCAKCRFVALVLAPFLARSALASIMGADLLADAAQVADFAALMDPGGKPFECVGERRESAAALRLLGESDEWRDTAVVAALAPRARAMVSDADVAALLAPDDGLAFPDPVVAGAVERYFAGPR